MTKEEVKKLEKILLDTIPSIAKQFNSIHRIRISYNDEGATVTIKLTQVAEGEEVNRESIYKAAAIKHGYLFGITPDMIGMKTKDGNTLIGVSLTKRKYPIVIKGKDDKIRLTTEMYIDMLKRQNGLLIAPALTLTNPPV